MQISSVLRWPSVADLVTRLKAIARFVLLARDSFRAGAPAGALFLLIAAPYLARATADLAAAKRKGTRKEFHYALS
jgi:hypothetical protein